MQATMPSVLAGSTTPGTKEFPSYWASADLTAPGDHGADEAVITDGMILSAVTALTASN